MKNRLITSLLLFFGLYLIVSFSRDILDLVEKGKEVEKEQVRLEKLQGQNKDLKKQLEHVQSPQFLEKEAREKLGLAKPGETVVIVPENVEEIIRANQSQISAHPEEPNWKKWWKLFF